MSFQGFRSWDPLLPRQKCLPLSHSALQQGDLLEYINYKITDQGCLTRQRMFAGYTQTDKVPIWKVFTPSASLLRKRRHLVLVI